MTNDASETDRVLHQETDLPPRAGLLRVRLKIVASDPRAVLQRVREVINAILEHTGSWPTIDAWKSLLPPWFVTACGPEITAEQAMRQQKEILTLPPAELAARLDTEVWSLSEWLYWMHPDERLWSWSSAVVSARTLVVTLDVEEYSTPLGALEWTFRAAGAQSVSNDLP